MFKTFTQFAVIAAALAIAGSAEAKDHGRSRSSACWRICVRSQAISPMICAPRSHNCVTGWNPSWWRQSPISRIDRC